MYYVIIYGCHDEFAAKVHDRVFNRRGLIRFLSRHASKLIDYGSGRLMYVAVSRNWGPARPVNFLLVWLFGKKHMSNRIPTFPFSNYESRRKNETY